MCVSLFRSFLFSRLHYIRNGKKINEEKVRKIMYSKKRKHNIINVFLFIFNNDLGNQTKCGLGKNVFIKGNPDY